MTEIKPVEPDPAYTGEGMSYDLWPLLTGPCPHPLAMTLKIYRDTYATIFNVNQRPTCVSHWRRPWSW